MFTAKDKEQLQKDLVSGSKSPDGETHRVPQIHTPGKSLQTLQRNLGNSYLQASNPTITQIATDVNGLRLQRACACGSTCANCATKGDEQRILQPKLTIGSPNDRYEQEADLVADQIMRMPEPTIQRQMGLEEDEEEGIIQRKIANSITPLQRDSTDSQPLSEAPPSVHEVLRSPGQPLDFETRAFMEPRFRYDFNGVRVHTNDRAAHSAKAVNAIAYTVDRNIVFDSGKYAPQTIQGKRLLAHELVHVIQQSQLPQAARIQRLPRQTEADPIHDPLVEAFRRDNGLPPPPQGPSDAEIKYGTAYAQWLQRGNVPAPATTPTLATVAEPFNVNACRVSPPLAPNNFQGCVAHSIYVNILNQIVSNINQISSPYAPGIAALYRALLQQVIAAGQMNFPTPMASRSYTIANVSVAISRSLTIPVPNFTLTLQQFGGANGQYMGNNQIYLNETSQAAQLAGVTRDVSDIERTAYHEMIHFFNELVTQRNQAARSATPAQPSVQVELDRATYEPFRASFVAVAIPLLQEAFQTLTGQTVTQLRQSPRGLQNIADSFFNIVLNEALSRIEEAVYLELRQGHGFSRAQVRSLTQPWLHLSAYWSISDPGMQNFINARHDRINATILPVVQNIQEEYLNHRPIQ